MGASLAPSFAVKTAWANSGLDSKTEIVRLPSPYLNQTNDYNDSVQTKDLNVKNND